MLKVIATVVGLLVLLSPFSISAQVTDDCPNNLPVIDTNLLPEEFDRSTLYGGFCVEFGGLYTIANGYPSGNFLYNWGPEYYASDAHYYSNELMDWKLAKHGFDLAALGVEDGVALQPCSTFGSEALLTFPGVDHKIRVIVADCASPEHQEFRQEYWSAAIDLPPRLAEKYGFTSDGGIEGVIVCMDVITPELTCTGTPVLFRDWFDQNIRYMRRR